MAQYVSFQVGAHRQVAAPIEFVDGVQPFEILARIPGAPAHLHGMTTRLGFLLPIVDLPVLLGLADAPSDVPCDGSSWLVVLHHQGIRMAVATRELPNLVQTTEGGEDSLEALDVPALLAAILTPPGDDDLLNADAV